MTDVRRRQMQNVKVTNSTHAGLWLDKFTSGFSKSEPQGSENIKPEKAVVDAVAAIPTPSVYVSFYQQWVAALTKVGVATKQATVQGRLSIGLGTENVLETAISLHRTYGVPYIPGSAVKGLAASYARNHLDESKWGKNSAAYQTMFGNTTSAGYLTFYDALYVPKSGRHEKALHPDVITVHHPDYYQQGDKPPADWDSPTPVPFLSATGDYLFAIAGDTAWVEAAFEILAKALQHEGIGAKTSSGYGRMVFKGLAQAPTKADQAAEASSATQAEPHAVAKRRLLKESASPGKLRGTVSNVRRDGDYADILPAKGGATVFVHRNQVRSTKKTLVEGQVVEYKLGSYQGKTQAEDVHILLDPE